MNKICTTIEQSKKLLELGIDVNTADMWWETNVIPCIPFPVNDVATDWSYAQENGILPAWSLSALVDLMPKNVKIKRSYIGWRCDYYSNNDSLLKIWER